MLSKLRKTIDHMNDIDEVNEMMLEATDSLADAFIEDDGEADIDEKTLESVLKNIPAYDEEEELNKKLSKLTETFIPEDLEGEELDEAKASKPLKKMTDKELEDYMWANREDYESFTSNPYYNPKDASDYLTASHFYNNVKLAYEEQQRRETDAKKKEERKEKFKKMFGMKK